MTTKKKYVNLVSERGVAVWPHVNSPDTKYNKDGLYHTKLAFDPSNPKQAAFLAALEERLEAWVESLTETLPPAKRKTLKINPVVQDEIDRDSGDETGRKLVSFKMYATGKDRDGNPTKREPRFFDAKGARIPMSLVPRLSGGSVLKIDFSPSEYHTGKNECGITLYLNGIQIITAVEYSAGKSPFGDEGDGFVAPRVEESTSFGNEESHDDASTQEDGDF
jgi:hypothetical protein